MIASKLIKIIGLATVMMCASSAAVGAGAGKESQTGSKNAQSGSKAPESTVIASAKRSMLGKNGGAPGAVLRAYFAAIEARNWNGMKSLTIKQVRETFEQDERDGYQNEVMEDLRQTAPAEFDIVEAWTEGDFAFVRFQGLAADRKIQGLAELAFDEGGWKVLWVFD
jgi:predicted ester cyclase